ncbi:MAG: inositol monophosphatase family protein [Pseudomonadota bacterium]
MHPLVNIGVKAARKAGALMINSLNREAPLEVFSKGPHDYVTQVDRDVEACIIDVIHKAYPHHAILGEESGHSGDNDICWIIDPIDGTTNAIHGFPHYAVSIAVRMGNDVSHAIIYDPLRDELFTASKGAGAYLNQRRIRVPNQVRLSDALIGTGFPFKDMRHLDAYLRIFKELCPAAAGIRRAGAATLDLAYVAAGRLDGFFEFGLQPWDFAAGNLLVSEAGGFVTDFKGGNDFSHGNILAGSGRVHKELLVLIQQQLRS